MNVLFIGDIFAGTGRRVLAQRLSSLVAENAIDVCVANGENTAGGKGITHRNIQKLRSHGVNVITGGNHSFANADGLTDLVDDPHLLRPLNYPPANPGKGSCVYTLADGRKLGVVNLGGRVYSNDHLDCPFRTGQRAIEELSAQTKCILVDFHAEATSEKGAFARYIDGRVSAVCGTHTHVQTADERILPGGTAFISDVGMTGSEDSIIGTEVNLVIRKFMLQTYVRFSPSEKGPMLNAVIISIDDETGKALSITRVFERIVFK